MNKKKLLLIGWDAADWKIIWPLINKGLMPALKGLIQKGVYGNMSTMNPPYSPMLWTSVATGKTPDKHGILGFIELLPNMEGIRPVTATSRNTRALWNILHHEGYRSNLVGWWPSYPAEPINGVVITDKFQKVSMDPKKPNPLLESAVHPKEVIKDFIDLRMFPFEITKEHILPFIPNALKIDQEKDSGLKAFAKIMAENVSVHNAATKLLRTTEWDFMAVYYDLIDHFCHAFMKYHPPILKGVDKEKYEIYNEGIVGAYRFQDMMLERTLQLIDDDTTVIIMSDHGFESGAKRILEMPKLQAAAALEHRQFGIFVASGPNIKKNEKVFGLGLVDIAPTVLHFFDLPVGKDMDGRVALDIFNTDKEVKYIDSWDTVAGDFAELGKKHETNSLTDQEALEELVELGYIDRPDEKKEVAIQKTKLDLKHNLARVYLGKKNYSKAKELLLELIKAKTEIDYTIYYLDLIKIYLRERNYDEAQKYLTKIKEADTKVKYNLYFSEVSILLGKGKNAEALETLQKAVKKDPNSEVWYRIGLIHKQQGDLKKAQKAFEKAIEIEPDKAKHHNSLAETLFDLKEYEEAVDYALTSIELVKYFPNAHYTLGKALEKMGDLENAKIAYETAARLRPKTFHRAEKAVENLEEKLNTPIEFRNKVSFKYREDQIVVVSGLPRSGTSLMMQMMDKGGLDILSDKKRKADISNPKGYYEYEPVMSIYKDNSWLNKAKNKAVKIVAPLLNNLDRQYRYKIIFMKRNLDEVIKSQRKMTGKDPDTIPIHIFNTYVKQLQFIESWKDKEPGVELIYVDYNELIQEPEQAVDKVISLIGSEMDKTKMIQCVDKSLYRNKVVSNSN